VPGSDIYTKQGAYRTYVIGLELPRQAAPRALFWDTSEKRGEPDPYHYVRTSVDPDTQDCTLLSGGEDHRTGEVEDAPARFARLEQWTRERFPGAGAVQFRWSGQVQEPAKAIALLGRHPDSPESLYVITGDSGNGMTHGTMGARIVSDLIGGRENPWAKLYDPSAHGARGLGRILKEAAAAVVHSAATLTGGDVGSEDAVLPGQGAVVRHGLVKVAVYRNEDGELARMSAACPHLGCIVHWNQLEKTWDCPCHGSRFDRRGAVLNGPANVGLQPLQE
jgi:Rieske Fe-S protein